jgi:nocturnin
MGSFTSAPQIKNIDYQDDKLEIPVGMSTSDLYEYCRLARGEHLPQLLFRKFLKSVENDKFVTNTDISDGLRVLKLNTYSKNCSVPTKYPKQIRVLTWNLLSQSKFAISLSLHFILTNKSLFLQLLA